MFRITLGIILFAGLALISDGIQAAPECVQVRGAIDIGSGTTKMLVARVDTCSRRVLSVLAPGAGERLERPVKLKQGIITNVNGDLVFDPRVENTLIGVLLEFKKIGETHGAQVFSAAATSAFRQVSTDYREKLINRIDDRLGISIHLLMQTEEARLGYSAAATELGATPEVLLVWDIGGGSMQISYWDESLSEVRGYEGTCANNWMFNFVLSCLKQRGTTGGTSPNPIVNIANKSDSDNCLLTAIREAEQTAYSTCPVTQLAKFRSFPLVVGIGGVHVYSNCEITGQAPECSYEREQLFEAIVSHAHLTDMELVQTGRAGSLAYAPMRITAGALTVGFMRAFGFERVRSLKIDMAHGILLEPAYWD